MRLWCSRSSAIAEGDLVAVHSHYVAIPGDRGRAVLDLFRVRDGKIVEHWDAVQDVPAGRRQRQHDVLTTRS